MNLPTSAPSFEKYLTSCQQRVKRCLQTHCQFNANTGYTLSAAKLLERLFNAINYSVLNGGKRIRPMLVYASAAAIGRQINDDSLDLIATSVEMIHCYSLVHDDLPAMDDDDLRRGQPTCHIQFDEATAILAGDALQAMAFDLLCEVNLNAELRLKLIKQLSLAAGPYGMVGGQMIDLEAVDQVIDLPHLEKLHQLKTGAMISAAVSMGATAAAANAEQLQALNLYSKAIGLAFQVQDDILDIESDTATLGKTQGADLALNKPTYPALMGMAEAKTYSQQLKTQAIDALSPFGEKAIHLRQLAEFIVARRQ